MPIIDLISQPSTGELRAAYRPLVLIVRASRTDDNPRPPVVYCDIYVDSVFYKSQLKTQYLRLNDDDSHWLFDIQDACQEVLEKKLAANTTTEILEVAEIMKSVYCKFRSSGINSEGFITAEDTAPVQGTGMNAPVAGTGTQSNSFWIVNSALQHLNNQDLATHLSFHKKNGVWANTTYPLSHRPNGYKIGLNDTDVFPIIHLGENIIKCLVINYKIKGQNRFHSFRNCNVPIGFAKPVIAVDDSYEIYVNETLNLSLPGVKSNDIDENIGSATVTAGTFATVHGSIIINSNGSFSYTPVTDYVGSDTYTYTLTNQYGSTDTATITINIKEMEAGIIVMWSGSPTAVPSGWALCDGSGGTPDLGGMFIPGYKASDPDYDAIGDTGGAKTVTLTGTQQGSLKIKSKIDDATGGGGEIVMAELTFNGTVLTRDGGSDQISDGTEITVRLNNDAAPFDKRPTYYTLAYIIKL